MYLSMCNMEYIQHMLPLFRLQVDEELKNSLNLIFAYSTICKATPTN